MKTVFEREEEKKNIEKKESQKRKQEEINEGNKKREAEKSKQYSDETQKATSQTTATVPEAEQPLNQDISTNAMDTPFKASEDADPLDTVLSEEERSTNSQYDTGDNAEFDKDSDTQDNGANEDSFTVKRIGSGSDIILHSNSHDLQENSTFGDYEPFEDYDWEASSNYEDQRWKQRNRENS